MTESLGVVAGRIDTAAAALGLGATALCSQPPGPGRTRRPGRLSRFGNGQPVAQPCFQTIERDLTVAGLRSGVVDDHAQLGTELRNEPLPYLEFNVAGRCEIDYGFHPGAGAVGVLSSGTARGIEAPRNRGGRHPSTGKQEYPVHAPTLHACTWTPRIPGATSTAISTAPAGTSPYALVRADTSNPQNPYLAAHSDTEPARLTTRGSEDQLHDHDGSARILPCSAWEGSWEEPPSQP